jgi:hypothetical protein
MVVRQPVFDRSRRIGVEKRTGDLDAFESRAKVRQVLGQRRVSDVAQLVVTYEVQTRTAIAEASADLLEIFGELGFVTGRNTVRKPIFAGRFLTMFEAGNAFANVVRKVRLAELTVVDDVDAAGDLLADGRRDVRAQQLGEVGIVVRTPFCASKDEFP